MRKILIVVDMQNDFVTGSLGTPEAQAIVPRVVEKVRECKENGYDIFFTQDTHEEDYLETLEGRYLPVEHCIEDTDGWNIISELNDFVPDRFDDFLIEKYTFGFDNWSNWLWDIVVDTDYDGLEENLLNDDEDERWGKNLKFEIIGLCTDICVISNALILRAQFPNSEIIVHADCCAGTTPEKHAAALEVMKSCQILVKGE